MKKILEVLQYGENDLRFNTDIDVKKNPETIMDLVMKTALAMTTTLWGGNELSVLAIIRALAIADLGVSVNRREMVRHLDESSEYVAKTYAEVMEEMKKHGAKVQTFAPGVKPSSSHS